MSWPSARSEIPRIVVTIQSKPPYGLEIALCVVITIILLVALALKSGQEYFLKRMKCVRVDVPEPLPDILQGVEQTNRSCSSSDDRRAGAGDISTEITLRPPSTNTCLPVSSSDSNMQVKESIVVSSSPVRQRKEIKRTIGLPPEDLAVDGSVFTEMAVTVPDFPPPDTNDFCCSPKATSDSEFEYDERDEETAEFTTFSDMVDFVTNVTRV